MPAGKLNLPIEQGATFRKKFVWKDKNKRPVNLTGYTALLHVRDKAGGTLLLEMSTANGRITLGTGGIITLYLPPEVTAALTFTSGVYDLKLMVGADDVRLLEGRVSVSPAITPRPA